MRSLFEELDQREIGHQRAVGDEDRNPVPTRRPNDAVLGLDVAQRDQNRGGRFDAGKVAGRLLEFDGEMGGIALVNY